MHRRTHKPTVLITGSSRGIGRAAALRFASEGWHVFVNGAHHAAALKETEEAILSIPNTSCTALAADVGNPEQVRTMFQTIYEETDALDLLINNAGIAYIGLLTDMTDEQWMQIMQTNLSSAFYCCREAIPSMVSKKSGKILNVSSMWGSCGASCEAAYSAAKSGIHGLTRALAKELAPSNIQVNAVAFGVIDTDMNRQLTEEEQLALAEEIPAGRFASAEEAASMLYQLAFAPEYLTGQIIGFDGGFV